MKMTCPHCGAIANNIRSKPFTPLIRELYHFCTNRRCGHIFVSQQEIVRTVVASDIPNPDIHIRSSSR